MEIGYGKRDDACFTDFDLVHHYHDYVKYFPTPSAEDQKRLKQDLADTGGALLYLVRQRSVPSDYGSTASFYGARCDTPGGYSAQPNVQASSVAQLARSKLSGLAAKISVCDPKWDSTPETEKVNIGGMILSALSPLDAATNLQVKATQLFESTTALKYADLHASQGMRALTKSERLALCAALDTPYAE